MPPAAPAPPARPAPGAGGLRALGTVLLALGLLPLALGALVILASVSDRRPPAPGEYGTGSSNWGWVFGLLLAVPGAGAVLVGAAVRSRRPVVRRMGAAVLALVVLVWAVRALGAQPPAGARAALAGDGRSAAAARDTAGPPREGGYVQASLDTPPEGGRAAAFLTSPRVTRLSAPAPGERLTSPTTRPAP